MGREIGIQVVRSRDYFGLRASAASKRIRAALVATGMVGVAALIYYSLPAPDELLQGGSFKLKGSKVYNENGDLAIKIELDSEPVYQEHPLPELGSNSTDLALATSPSESVEEELDSVNSSDIYSAPEDDLALKSVADLSSEPEWVNYVVEKGDTLSGVFSYLGIPHDDMYALFKNKDAKLLTKLKPGQSFYFILDKNGRLEKIRLKINSHTMSIFEAKDTGVFEGRQEKAEVSWQRAVISGVIDDNFYNSAKRAGMTPGQIQQIANVFQWRLNFSRELSKGDVFKVILGQEVLDGRASGKAEIGAVKIVNRAGEMTLYRHSDGLFYNEKGESTQNGFLKRPLEANARISSSFNLKRRHPVTRRVSPHHGTDYAVPVGTPVIAPSDGVVIKVTRHRLAGKYLVIKHGRQYTTRYLHLSKFLVKEGQKVTRGQRIALSGNTGRSTGAHLHYELHINNRPVNSLKAKLPRASELRGKEKQSLDARVKEYEAIFSTEQPIG